MSFANAQCPICEGTKHTVHNKDFVLYELSIDAQDQKTLKDKIQHT